MNFSVLLLLFVKCCLLSAALIKRLDIPEGKIVGGQEAKAYSRPYIVSLQKRFLWVRLHICGGSLLNEYWILTAGHCVKESWLMSWLPLDAVVGTHNVEKYDTKAQVSTVTKRVPHPLYDGNIGPHDIGVVRVDRPFTFTKHVQPIKLPIHYKMHTQGMNLAGWGALKSNIFIPDMPDKLQEVNVTFIPYDECHKAVDELTDEGNPLDKDANICTGPLTGGIAACSGDSGGPLVQFLPYNDYGENEYNESTQGTQENNTVNYSEGNLYSGDQHDEVVPVIFGVVSWGASPCGAKGAPTVYTKVTQYLDFIKYNTNNLSTENN